MAGAAFGDLGVLLFVAGQYLVILECHFSWQAQYLVILERHFLWQAQYSVKSG